MYSAIFYARLLNFQPGRAAICITEKKRPSESGVSGSQFPHLIRLSPVPLIPVVVVIDSIWRWPGRERDSSLSASRDIIIMLLYSVNVDVMVVELSNPAPRFGVPENNIDEVRGWRRTSRESA